MVLSLKTDQFFHIEDQGGYVWNFFDAVHKNVCTNFLLWAGPQILCDSLLP